MKFSRSAEMIQLLAYQLDVFQGLISESSDNLSKTNFHQVLLDISKKKLPFSHATKRAGVEGPLTSIKQLKSFANSMKNGRRRTWFTADELTVVNQLLNQLEYLLELKSYFDDRIFAFISKITSQWQTTLENVKKSKMADRKRKCLEDEFAEVNGRSQTTLKNMQKPKMVHRNQRCFEDVFIEGNGCSPTEVELERLIGFIDKIKAIESRWDDMIDCPELNLSFFEKETEEYILPQKERLPFALICYVMSDQLKKIEKCVELSRKWLKVALPKRNCQNISPNLDSACSCSKQYIMPWGSVDPGQHLPIGLKGEDPADFVTMFVGTGQLLSLPTGMCVGTHVKPILCRISPRGEATKFHNFVGTDSRKRIIETWMKILEVDESILVDEKRARRLRTELKRLANKKSRYSSLKDDYETTADKLERASSDYRNALLQRHSLNRKIWKGPGFHQEVEAMSKLYEVGDRIEASQKDMKMLKYSFALLQEDMALEASMRSSYIRFEENVKETLSSLDTQIEEKKKKKRKLDKELVLLKANTKWLESKYGVEELEKHIDEEELEVEESKERRNNDSYFFEQMNISIEGETTVDRLRATINGHRKTGDPELSSNSSQYLVVSDIPAPSDSDSASQDSAGGGLYSPCSTGVSSSAQTPSFPSRNRRRHHRCGRRRSTSRVDHVFDGLPYISIDVESEPEVASFNRKFSETEENGRISRIPILRNSSDFPRLSRNTDRPGIKLKVPGTQNPKYRAGGSGNQRETRIPKLIN